MTDKQIKDKYAGHTPTALYFAIWEIDQERKILERHITANWNLTFLQVGRQMSSQQNCRMIPGSSVASSRPPPIIVTLNFNFQQLLSATIGGGRKIFCDWHLRSYPLPGQPCRDREIHFRHISRCCKLVWRKVPEKVDFCNIGMEL